MSEEKMLPCPFCGADADYRHVNLHQGGEPLNAVFCLECRMRGPRATDEGRAIHGWNALPRALRWTKEPPTKPGFYWVRFDKEEVRMLEFRRHELKTIQKITEWEWAGPIPEPKEK